MNLVMAAGAQGNHVPHDVIALSDRTMNVGAHPVVATDLTGLCGDPSACLAIDVPSIAGFRAPPMLIVRQTVATSLMRLGTPNNGAHGFRLLLKMDKMTIPASPVWFIASVKNLVAILTVPQAFTASAIQIAKNATTCFGAAGQAKWLSTHLAVSLGNGALAVVLGIVLLAKPSSLLFIRATGETARFIFRETSVFRHRLTPLMLRCASSIA